MRRNAVLDEDDITPELQGLEDAINAVLSYTGYCAGVILGGLLNIVASLWTKR